MDYQKWCTLSEGDIGLVANCSSIEKLYVEFEIPQDLDENIKVLDLTNRVFLSFRKKNVEKYKNNLVRLYIKDFTPWTESEKQWDEDVLASLNKLEYLQMSGCSYFSNPQFPITLKILHIENSDVYLWNLDMLKSLEQLHASKNFYNSFPLLHKSAPLKFVDLRQNNIPFSKIEIEMLAPYCELTHFLISLWDPEPHGNINTETYCHCKTIEWWFNNTNVQHEPLACLQPAGGPLPTCTFQVSNKAEELRDDCLSRINPDVLKILKNNWYILAIVIVVSFCLSIPLVVFARRKLGSKSRKKRKRRHRKLIKKFKHVDEEIIEEEYYEEYDEEVDWQEEEIIEEMKTTEYEEINEENVKTEEEKSEE